jgi:uncharacterized membrane protein YhaH (DUF805 family)
VGWRLGRLSNGRVVRRDYGVSHLMLLMVLVLLMLRVLVLAMLIMLIMLVLLFLLQVALSLA